MSEAQLPAGEYAIVEIMGHRTMIGRVEEMERFGTKMLQIEPIFRSTLLDPVMIGGASIYQFTPCSAEIAASRAPTQDWQLPPSVRVTVPAALLPQPDAEPETPAPSPAVDDDDDYKPF
jgi:hypothetical protein